ncbi:MAG: hypothetical protein KAV83_12700 [Desulfobacterales bacterium]|nr:hypothetical protein [Desulfobacterales bacterium]
MWCYKVVELSGHLGIDIILCRHSLIRKKTMGYDESRSGDERLAAWKYLVPLDENSAVLLIGDPSWGMVRGLSRSVKQVFVVSLSDVYEKDTPYLATKGVVSNIRVIRWSADNKLPLPDNSVHAIAIMNKKSPTGITLKECNQILTPGGAILLTSSKFKAQSSKLFDSINSNNQIYAIVPGFGEPRWIIPLKSNQISGASFKLYNPAKLWAKTKKWVMSATSRIGLKGLLMPDRIMIAHKKKALRSSDIKGLHNLLSEVLGRGDIEIALSTGTPGYYRKVTGQVMAPDGKILAYAKIADTDQAKKLVEHEANILRRLEGLNILSGDIPRVLYFGSWGKETVVVQSNVKKDHSLRPKKLDEGLITFLSELFGKSAAPKILRKSVCLVDLENNIKKLKGRITKDWEYRLAKSLEIIHKNLSGQKIPLGICHGDFTPFNTYIGRGSLSVFDWEYARKESIPFWDVFHFLIQASTLRNRFEPSTLLDIVNVKRSMRNAQSSWGCQPYKHNNPTNTITRSTRTLSRLISKYADSINLDFNPNLSVFLLFYLADASSFYLDMFINYGSISNKNRSMLDVWAEMMDGTFDES